MTHQQMVELYGADNLVLLSQEQVEGLALLPADAETLTTVGLPRASSLTFTVDVGDEPEFLEAIDVTKRDGTEHREVILGGAPGDAGMTYSLSAYEGFIMLAQLNTSTPRGEIVNNNVREFIEFVYLVEQFQREASEDPATRTRQADELRRTLVAIDPFAFEQPDDWWNMVVQMLSGQGMFDLLDQT